jgi:hypothetical protein
LPRAHQPSPGDCGAHPADQSPGDYRVPRSGCAPDAPRRPSVDEVERAIVEIAEQNPTDGYRIVTAWVTRNLGRAVNRKLGAARDARAQA